MADSFFVRYKTPLLILGVIVLVIIMLISWIVGTYNGLVSSSQNVDGRWADVQTQYQRRADLIPNLVQVVAGYAKQEKTVLEDVTNARARVGQVQISAADLNDPEKLKAFQDAQAQLGGSLSRLLAVAEAYPELKSNENFLSLQDQLEGTENRISVSRRDFNAAVQGYNVQVQRFPAVLVAGVLGFHPKAYFQADAGAQTAPVIDKNQLVQ